MQTIRRTGADGGRRGRGAVPLPGLTLTVVLALAFATTLAGAQPAVCPGATEGSPGGTIAVPILIDDPLDVDAFGLALRFESAVLAFTSVERSLLTGGWALVDGRLLESGVVRIGGASGGDPIASSAPDTLCFVVMTVLAAPPSSDYTCTAFEDDLAGAADCSGAFAGANPVTGSTWGRVKELYSSP